MIRVLRILNRFNVGGPTHNAIFLTKFIGDEFETKLVAGKKLDSEASSEYHLKKYKINYEVLDSLNRNINFFKDFKSFFEIRSLIKKYKPTIVHTHASKSGALGRLAAISMNVPIIIHTFHGHVFHSYFGRFKTAFYIFIERFLAKRSSSIITISELQAKEIIKEFKICKEEKISIVPLGFDLSKFHINQDLNREIFRKDFNINQEDIVISIVGRLTKIKNHEFFLDAISNLKNKTKKKLKVFIVGDGEDKNKLQENCINNGLSFSHYKNDLNADVIFTSWQREVEKIYAGSDIVCLSSLNEGTPVTLIEAQAAKKPVVSTDVGGIKDIVIDGKTGFLSKSNDMETYVNNLIKLIEDKELRDSFGEQGHANVIQKYSYKRLVGDVRKLYLGILNEKNI